MELEKRTREKTHLGAEAVADSTNVLDAHVADGLDGLDDDGVNSLLGVRVVAAAAVRDPLAQLEALGAVERDGVAVEEVDDDGQVAALGKGVGHELAVLPDANDVGQVQDADVLAGRLVGRRGDVGLDGVVNFDDFALGLAPVCMLASFFFFRRCHFVLLAQAAVVVTPLVWRGSFMGVFLEIVLSP